MYLCVWFGVCVGGEGVGFHWHLIHPKLLVLIFLINRFCYGMHSKVYEFKKVKTTTKGSNR
jgi:hypothetical protein